MFDFGGIGKGIGYYAKCGKILAWAVTHMNLECLKDCAHVGELQAKEMLTEAGDVKTNALGGLFNGDFTAGSRHAAQALIAKYGAQAGVKS